MDMLLINVLILAVVFQVIMIAVMCLSFHFSCLGLREKAEDLNERIIALETTIRLYERFQKEE